MPHEQDTSWPPDGKSWCYFLELSLENVRCFGDRVTIDLRDSEDDTKPARWTVILGENGTGKTTLLQALTVTQPSSYQRDGELEVDALLGRGRTNGFHGWRGWQGLAKGASGSVSELRYVTGTSEQSINNAEVSLHWHSSGLSYGFVGSPEEIDLLMVSYGASRRVRDVRQDGAHDDHEEGYETLFDDRFSLPDPAERVMRAYLLSTLDDDENRGDIEKARGRFERLKECLVEALPDVRKISVKARNGQAVVLFDTVYGEVSFAQLSVGYRTMAAWVADLVVRMLDRYPESDAPLEEPAIVCIDEFDLHMHPSWQRESIAFLTARFPATQFIVTAHSPLVVQSAPDTNVVVLRRDGDQVRVENDPVRVGNWRIDQILTSELFGLKTARRPEVHRLLEERATLLGKQPLSDSERARLRELDAQAESIPASESAEVIEARKFLLELTNELKGSGREG